MYWVTWIALVAIVGNVVLAWQRERNRFALARLSVERGGPPVWPAALPPWVVSLRQGLAVLVLGVGLLVVGAGAWASARHVFPPPESQAASPPLAAPGFRPAPPPPPSPAMEAWHRAQEREAVGQACVGAGVILSLLGMARAAFAAVERRYAGINATPTA